MVFFHENRYFNIFQKRVVFRNFLDVRLWVLDPSLDETGRLNSQAVVVFDVRKWKGKAFDVDGGVEIDAFGVLVRFEVDLDFHRLAVSHSALFTRTAVHSDM